MAKNFSLLLTVVLAAAGPTMGATVAPSTGTVRLAASDREHLTEALEQLKRGTFVTVELMNGSILPGLFQSYDDYYEKVWIVPKGDAGLFQAKSVRLSSVQAIEISATKQAQP